ncbi:stage II sporulation protein D [Parabacteroides sp. PF5-6]|nr:stage II sporulation protein D [Parabacteroides sp. PF5-6]
MKYDSQKTQFIDFPETETPAVSIGIMIENVLSFFFNDEYIHVETGDFLVGEQRALLVNDKILFNGKLYKELYFEPVSKKASFALKEVTIGKGFHWERKEDQCFNGALDILITETGLLAINEIDVEDYLISVISSEMNATCSKEMLKTHAVISRSWLLAQIEKSRQLAQDHTQHIACYQDSERLIRWYDREDHSLYDVCADDHCQRYQGITKASTARVEEAVRETSGEILAHEEQICDARFSKCCGGVSEEFEHCWEPVHHPYLSAVRDNLTETTLPDLTREEEAEKWIRTTPDAFCHTSDQKILAQILTDYDQETPDFYRWKVEYTQAELSALFNQNMDGLINLGLIRDLVPIKRGTSGRIEELKIIGTCGSIIIGKELEIRRILSSTHLFSSAFVVDRLEVKGGIPGRFVLTGAGWGHGVGLCQIGAAVMSTQGHTYRQILSHYYPGAQIKKRY